MSKLKSNLVGVLIMVISFWCCYGVGWYFMPENPFAEWYGLPLMITLAFTWLYSCYFAAIVNNKLENKGG